MVKQWLTTKHMVKSPLCSLRLHLFDHEYCKSSNIVKYYYKLKFAVLIYLQCVYFVIIFVDF